MIRKLLFISIISFSATGIYAQIEPTQNDEQTLVLLNVKKLSSYYYSSRDTIGADGKLVLEKTFDNDGKVIKKYLLSLWEAVSYSKSTSYTYNEKGQLIEENIKQAILNLNQRDDDYISTFGQTPLHEKINYSYDENGHLKRKEIFLFSTDKLSNEASPSQVVKYDYKDNLLSREVSTSVNTRVFNKNFTVDFDYDSCKRLSLKTVSYGPKLSQNRITDYRYDSASNLVEEKTIDSSIPRNNAHFRYVYNENEQVITKLEYDHEALDFVPLVNYRYDKHGHRISGDREVEYSYYDNGLIRSEWWKDVVFDQEFYFVTKYGF